MTTVVGPRERAIFSNALTPLLVGICGHSSVVELKVDIIVTGKVTSVDCFSNITMEKAVMTKLDGSQACFELFFIPMKSIRAVRLPDYMPVANTLKDQVETVSGAKFKEERRKAKARQEKLRFRRQQQKSEKEAKQAALLNLSSSAPS